MTNLVGEVTRECSVLQHQESECSEYTPTLTVHVEKSKRQLWLVSIVDWGKIRLEDCLTAVLHRILQIKGSCIDRSLSSLHSAGTAMLCGVHTCLQCVLWAVTLLVMATSWMAVFVSSAVCLRVRSCLDHTLRRWRDKERMVQEVQDRGKQC